MEFLPKSNTQKKLLILHTFRVLGLPLTETQLIRIMGDMGWMNFFDLKPFLLELETNKLIETKDIGGTLCYALTDAGVETHELFISRIPAPFITALEEFAQKNRDSINREVHHVCDYHRNEDGSYTVDCRIMDLETPLLVLSLTVSGFDLADSIKQKWNDKAPDIYEEIIRRLF